MQPTKEVTRAMDAIKGGVNKSRALSDAIKMRRDYDDNLERVMDAVSLMASWHDQTVYMGPMTWIPPLVEE